MHLVDNLCNSELPFSLLNSTCYIWPIPPTCPHLSASDLAVAATAMGHSFPGVGMEMMSTEPHGDTPHGAITFFPNKTNSYSLLNIYYALGTTHTGRLTHWITAPQSRYDGLQLPCGNWDSERGTRLTGHPARSEQSQDSKPGLGFWPATQTARPALQEPTTR